MSFENIFETLKKNKELLLIAAVVIVALFLLTRNGTANTPTPTTASNA